MARGLAAELPEILDVVERHGRRRKNFASGSDFMDARQIQQGIEQHRGVSIGEHEAVAVRPERIFRIVAQKLLPQRIGDRSQTHGRSGMARIRLLHRVYRKSANRVDTQLIEFATGGDRLVTHGHQFSPGKPALLPYACSLDEVSADMVTPAPTGPKFTS